MGITVLFALLGNEINVAKGTKANKLANGLDKGATIIIGGFVAAGILTATSGAGDAGRKFSVGLATVSAVTAALVYGQPVWTAITDVVGGKSSTPTSGTDATAPTTGTGSDPQLGVTPIAETAATAALGG